MAFKPTIQFLKLGQATLQQVVTDMQFKVLEAFQRLATSHPQVEGVTVRYMDFPPDKGGKGILEPLPLYMGPTLPLKLQAGVITVIQHKLGRRAKGWYLTRQVGFARVAEVPETEDFKNPFPGSQFFLTSDADTTVDVFVF